LLARASTSITQSDLEFGCFLCGEEARYLLRHRWRESGTRPVDQNVFAGDGLIGHGFVYLLKSGRHYKLGRTNSVGRREYELAIQLPERAERVHAIKTDDPAGIEGYWHGRFAERRRNGEWFELSRADLRAFQRRKYM
jgi:hypothetical protein